MIKHGGTIVWSPTDLTSAAACEYGFLKALDRKLGGAPALVTEPDPLRDQIAKLGNAHEEQVLLDYQSRYGPPRAGGGVVVMERAETARAADLLVQAEATKAAFATEPDLVCQAGFFDGEFHGYADFIRRTDQGWVVADTKIARSAKTSALLQIAAYADQLLAWGLPVAPYAELILGTGETHTFELADILPVYEERRDRLRTLIADHLAAGEIAVWDEPGIRACGSCADCSAGAEATDDLILVAGLRMAQRRKFKDAGIHTVPDLVAATAVPQGMSTKTFTSLQAQARLQWDQIQSVRAGRPVVSFEVFAAEPLHKLPAPSEGDLFFDFEGDPMFSGGDGRWGLEYLWGILRARRPDGSLGEFLPLWADDREQEWAQLIAFLDLVAQVRAEHPSMHVYHYAPYEITALKRLVAEYKTHEAELDDLLRAGVFVDLYAVVRGSVRISQPSYSIKKLEPLYMSHDRIGDVTKGDDSIAQYHCYRDLRGVDPAKARELRDSIVDYNRYDCESTLELRDWLLAQVAGASAPEPAVEEIEGQEAREEDHELIALRESLLARTGSAAREERSAEEQTWAMLEGALGYHQREDRPFWWAHFDRLLTPTDEWADTKDVLLVSAVEVLEEWTPKVGNNLPRRTLELRGVIGPGSTLQAPADIGLLYDVPAPAGAPVPVRGLRGASAKGKLTELEQLGDGTVRMTVVEALAKNQEPFEQLPMATVPGRPPSAKSIIAAIRSLAEQNDAAGTLVDGPAIDVLARRHPRLLSLPGLRHSEDRQGDLVASLLDLDRSFIAVQGPPGTGKTYLGSRVIRDLVVEHGWKIGVVGQSHAVVENMLGAALKAGLAADLVGKVAKRATGPNSEWLGLKDNKELATFCEERPGGYLIGGTAWTFTGAGVEPGSLDLLVIDEAGQFSLAGTVGVSVATDRLLLLGDPQQLPQVSQGFHGEPVNDSALAWVMDDHATMPRHLGYFLETSYRMHPAVCGAISRLSYGGELVSAEAASKRDLAGVRAGVEVVRLDHRECSVACPEEAVEILARIRSLIGKTWTDPDDSSTPRALDEHDFLVVTPYNAQRLLVTEVLRDAGLEGVRVGTVDKFQGQEAPVVLVSMTASSADDVPRGMEFLLNRNRVNVAISRAQWRAVLIRSKNLTAHMPSTPERLLELGGFIGLKGESR